MNVTRVEAFPYTPPECVEWDICIDGIICESEVPGTIEDLGEENWM